MDYRYILPSVALKDYIDYYFVIEKQRGEEMHAIGVFPSPQAEMVFTYGDENSSYAAVGNRDEQLTSDYAISGFFTQRTTYRNNDQLGVIMVGFKPWGIQPFVGFSVSEITDHNLDFKDVYPAQIRTLEDEVRSAHSIESRIGVIERFLLCILRHQQPDKLVEQSVHYINGTYGQIPVHILARHFHLSEKQFKRRFIRTIGVAPKLFSRIVRFQHVLGLMDTMRFKLLDMAIQSGFYDEAHFIKEFESFTSSSPKQFLQNRCNTELGSYFDAQVRKSVFYNTIYR